MTREEQDSQNQCHPSSRGGSRRMRPLATALLLRGDRAGGWRAALATLCTWARASSHYRRRMSGRRPRIPRLRRAAGCLQQLLALEMLSSQDQIWICRHIFIAKEKRQKLLNNRKYVQRDKKYKTYNKGNKVNL